MSRGHWSHRLAIWGVPVVVSLGAAAVVLRRPFDVAYGGVPSGVEGHRAAVATAHYVLPSYGRVPEFSLVDHHGRPFSRRHLQGQVWVADFIFTRCSGQCPLMTAEMHRLGREFARFPSLRMVSISVDPQWDTPEVLARYAQAVGAKTGRWDFVTGDAAAITRLCRDGFRLSSDISTHSTRLVLVDREGRIRGYYESSDAGQLAQLRRDLARLLKGS